MADAERHPATLALDLLLEDCEVNRTRGSGPGGQHRNKVETAVVITHRPTGISGQASERRSQHENRREAVRRLRTNLAVGYRLMIGDPGRYQISRLWQSRVVSKKRINVSESHGDFPAMLAEALDVIQACELDVKAAAEILGCSSSQMIKLLKKEPEAFQWLNRQRQKADLPIYR